MESKRLYIILFIFIFIVLVAGISYYFLITSAKYSLDKVIVSINQHDLSTFEKYVDVDEIIIQMLAELEQAISVDENAAFFGKEAVQAVEDLEIDTAAIMIKETVLDFVEKGSFDKNFVKREVISKILQFQDYQRSRALSSFLHNRGNHPRFLLARIIQLLQPALRCKTVV